MRLTIPNQLTLLRFALTPVFAWLYLKNSAQSQMLATIVFIIASITDWYDGWYARRFGVITRWGQFMDPLADKVLVSTALIIFAVMGQVKWWMVWIIVGRDVLVTGIRIYALWVGTPIITHVVAKWKTFAQMITILVILGYMNWLNYMGLGARAYQASYFDIIGILMSAVTFLTVLSAIIYIRENWRLILRFFKVILTFPFSRR